MHCAPHGTPNCQHSTCRRDRERREGPASQAACDPLTDPLSATHQAVYGAGSSSYDSGSSDCGSSSSSSSSYDSGSSSSCDSGGGW